MAPEGIRFALEGIDEQTFARVLRDLMKDPAFARPLQVQVQPPGRDGQQSGPALLTLAYAPEEQVLALQATQRLKTILLRYGVQIDSVWTPSPE